MSLSKFILNYNLIDIDNLQEVIADNIPEGYDSYWENNEILDINDNLLKVKVGDDWDPESDLHIIQFEINDEGKLKFISYTPYVEK